MFIGLCIIDNVLLDSGAVRPRGLKIAFLAISDQYKFVSTKLLLAAILDSRKSLSLAFLAI